MNAWEDQQDIAIATSRKIFAVFRNFQSHPPVRKKVDQFSGGPSIAARHALISFNM
jgi:hypothetical protein